MAKTDSGLAAISVDCWPLIAMGAEGSRAGPQLPSGPWIVMSRQAEPAHFRGRRAGDPKRPHGRRGESPRPRRSATSVREPVSSPRRRQRKKGDVRGGPQALRPRPVPTARAGPRDARALGAVAGTLAAAPAAGAD